MLFPRRSIVAALICLALAPGAHAWGQLGHSVVADLAQRHLSPAAEAEVERLLAPENTKSLADIASWPDEIRNQRKETGPWHYVDIPLTESKYDPERDCPKGDCVIDAINRFRTVLADPYKSPLERREALKFLVHFVGDLQMPLHGAENAGDHGGNKVLVNYFGQTMASNKYPLNLHTVW
ncbi:MAG: S1/P1 nuclease, partial [Dyella sp.]|nr:S1/P1 nuclease [Dyella sp.]